ncbi:MAG TPA: glycosyltransferase family 4 protein [Baekduia sp.]|uniref:glycosyltransferase family 4 protein n=1 Tax=Baekduia sp. TaxID=2600305 RepID=UPI002B94DC9E|nr:glycosyltransferase family 4 protein [Baekduia sp.]HMJ35062.1 glycosyltransferase family 4 protein [Baekduia sp.]
MRILLWHVHGSWTTAFVQGHHEYVVPVLPDRSPDGRGRARSWDWPASVVERTPAQLRDEDVDVVVVQQPHELAELCEAWTGRRPGRDLPTIYLEHNAPQGRIADLRHPAADRRDLTIAHVTSFNDLFWDCGTTRTRTIQHGIVDPGHRYTGVLPRAGVVINEARRRGRVTGTDLLPRFARAGVPIDLFGMDAARLGGVEDLAQSQLHDALARRRCYLHPVRWTSLGLSLIEAMHLGMPVVALATTEVPEAVPAQAGTVSTRFDALARAARALLDDPDAARAAGDAARAFALERFGLHRFLTDWDDLLEEVVADAHRAGLRAR